MYLKNLINTFTALLERKFYVTSHSHWGWNGCTGAPRLHQLDKFTIFDKIHWSVTLGTPPSDVGPEWRLKVSKIPCTKKTNKP